ncbi:unnamed protein product [Moneuplotes crassus]|uniref:Uncharacterized protein n=1 Tax=Euplotes crassus TaxID=5936 RepID=A0AAD1XFK7_EUPCR|nr:unnamed protein product [Moneuplotes crassus]
MSKSILFNVDHNYEELKFATSESIVQVWDYERSEPISKFDWGMDAVNKLKWNLSETNLILESASDGNICLYDIRENTPLKRLFLKNKSSCLTWNPYEPINFVVGNEDSNCYTFDMRKLDEAKMIHKDHTNAIHLNCLLANRERILIFGYNNGRSREVYHTKRMQQVNAIAYSMDSKFIISGSEDTNVRIWKSHASYSLNPMLSKEKEKIAYSNRLKRNLHIIRKSREFFYTSMCLNCLRSTTTLSTFSERVRIERKLISELIASLELSHISLSIGRKLMMLMNNLYICFN